MKEEKEMTVPEAAEIVAGDREFTSVVIQRSFSHNGRLAGPGYTWYKYSYSVPGQKGKLKTKGAVQIALSYEKRVGEEAVKDYVTNTYILKRKVESE